MDYDPRLGRFTQVDPLWQKYPGWSPYVYALDNPLRYVDQDGRKIIDKDTGKPISGLEAVTRVGHVVARSLQGYNSGELSFFGQLDIMESIGLSHDDHSHGFSPGTIYLGQAVGLPANAIIVNSKLIGGKTDFEDGLHQRIAESASGEKQRTLEILSSSGDIIIQLNLKAGKVTSQLNTILNLAGYEAYQNEETGKISVRKVDNEQ